ncbi:MAG: uracil-DNA glycosylase [Candidatus Omnitrophota bacterium]
MNVELNPIIEQIKYHIELEKLSGVEELLLKPVEGTQTFESEVIVERNVMSQDNDEILKNLNSQVTACTACSLYQSRSNVVFGKGNSSADLMFVGEAPGYQEDIQGEPFVGKAGDLLTKIIEAIKLKREDVYIANCLKCRPPNNRNPLPSEVVACRDYLLTQVRTIKPKVICCLGKFAAQTLLMSEVPISKLRGQFYDYEGAKLMPTFHPAYLLRNPQDKRLVWEDMKQIRDYLKSELKG